MAATVNVGAGPNDVAVDQSSRTAYVTNGNDNTVSVVDIARCKARNTSGCDQIAPVVAVGAVPVADVFDAQEHTVYVTDTGDNTVSMIDAATCNAEVVSGCNHVLKLVVGANPDFAAVDPATRTLYVVNAGASTVSVINAATCNATTASGCGAISTVTVGTAPTGAAVDDATHTVYVATGLGVSGPGSVSMINTATCNAGHTTGCTQTPRTAPAGVNAEWVAVDPSTHTVYVAGAATNLGFVDVIDDATCNATVTAGCRSKPLAVTVGSGPFGVVVDPVTESVFVANEEDSTVSVIDGSTCNAGFTSGCNQHPPTVAVGFNPAILAVDPGTDTVYVPSMNENTVSVLNGAACTLTHENGCRHAAPTTTVGAGPSGVATDQANDTVYVTNQHDNTLSVINGARCNAWVRSGCGRKWPTVATGSFPQAVVVDQRTDTVYVANMNDNTVSVIDGATCNATNHSGCGQAPAAIAVGSQPVDLAVNDVTDTVYVTNVANGLGNTVSVIDGATCNATNHSGCNQIPPVVSVGNGPVSVAVDQRTDTVYVADSGGRGPGNTVSVIDGATCNATTHSGCGQTPATVVVGSAPGAIAVNETTDTVYVANGFFAFTPTTSVSVIDGATCNANITTGCGQTPATMMMGGNPFAVAVDHNTDTVYASSIIDSVVYVFNGATCNATVTSGCSQIPRSVPTGGWPGYVAVSTATHTVYVADNVDGEVSFFRAR